MTFQSKREIYEICELNKITEVEEKSIEQILRIESECNLSRWKAQDYCKLIIAIDSMVIIAKVRETTTGFLTARFIKPEAEANFHRRYIEADILNIGVLNDFQRQGIGSGLLHKMMQKALETDVESIWLEVRESNLQAISFYREKGFTNEYTRTEYYANPRENAVVMKLSPPEKFKKCGK